MELVVEVHEAGQTYGGHGEGAEGFVVFGDGAVLKTLLIGSVDVVFEMFDDVVKVKELGAFNWGGVADGTAFDVEAVFEGVEVAGLPAAAAFEGLNVGHF